MTNPNRRPFRKIGLTGGIGCGKSLAAEEFTRLGVEVIDSDALAHQVTSPGGEAIPAIRQAFGEEYLAQDGSLNRSKMREYVFSHKPALTLLESITHPLIRKASQAAVDVALQKNPPYLLFMIPLLFESNDWQNKFEKIIVLDCSPQTQIQRVMARNHHSRQDVEKIMAAQISREERLKHADFIIKNDGTIHELYQQVGKIHDQLMSKSQ